MLKKSVVQNVMLHLAAAMLIWVIMLPTPAIAQERSAWSKYRTPITIGGGTLAGAGIGGLAGGRKGAIIGALAGAGTSSIFEIFRTKNNRDRKRAYYQGRSAGIRHAQSRHQCRR